MNFRGLRVYRWGYGHHEYCLSSGHVRRKSNCVGACRAGEFYAGSVEAGDLNEHLVQLRSRWRAWLSNGCYVEHDGGQQAGGAVDSERG